MSEATADVEAGTWLATAAEQLGVALPSPGEVEALLDAAKHVAHNTERRYAPLTCYLLGLAGATGGDVAGSAAELARLARTFESA